MGWVRNGWVSILSWANRGRFLKLWHNISICMNIIYGLLLVQSGFWRGGRRPAGRGGVRMLIWMGPFRNNNTRAEKRLG